MASKTFVLDEIGEVTVRKSKRSKHLRITVKHNGAVLVSVPQWTPYLVALEYAKTKQDWIKDNIPQLDLIHEGAKIGKAHRITFSPRQGKNIRTKLSQNLVTVYYPADKSVDQREVQDIATKASIRALTVEAKNLLPQRLNQLAESYGFTYKTLKIRSLKSRWGSCSSNGDITLSCYLMQLPWKEIDYVLLHELTHTLYMSHGQPFWDHLQQVMPEAKQIRKLLNQRKPHITV